MRTYGFSFRFSFPLLLGVLTSLGVSFGTALSLVKARDYADYGASVVLGLAAIWLILLTVACFVTCFTIIEITPTPERTQDAPEVKD